MSVSATVELIDWRLNMLDKGCSANDKEVSPGTSDVLGGCLHLCGTAALYSITSVGKEGGEACLGSVCYQQKDVVLALPIPVSVPLLI